MPRPDSIRAIGLQKYLNSRRAENNGYGYQDFVKFMQLPKPPSNASLARIFGVSELTINKYILIYREESQ